MPSGDSTTRTPPTSTPSPAEVGRAAEVVASLAGDTRGRTLSRAEFEACRAAGAFSTRARKDPLLERERRLEEAGIPLGFRSAHPEHAYDGLVSSGRALMLSGPVGSGKTLLACRVALSWVGRAKVRFVTSAGLMAAMASTFGTGRTEDGVLAPYLSADLVVLDDLGKEPTDERTLSRLFRLVDGRYSARRATVVTSQFTPSALAARLARRGDAETAEAIASRLGADRGWCVAMRTGAAPGGGR